MAEQNTGPGGGAKSREFKGITDPLGYEGTGYPNEEQRAIDEKIIDDMIQKKKKKMCGGAKSRECECEVCGKKFWIDNDPDADYTDVCDKCAQKKMGGGQSPQKEVSQRG